MSLEGKKGSHNAPEFLALSRNDVDRALSFSTLAHDGQKRKYTGEDYICHPIEVATIVSTVPNDKAMIQAALLHDTVEDTDATIEDIYQHFGSDVGEMVFQLTDCPKWMGNRKVRKEINAARLGLASDRVKTIKLADTIANSRSIIKHDPDFAKVYMKEKERLLEKLDGGDAKLLAQCWDIIYAYKAMVRRAAYQSY